MNAQSNVSESDIGRMVRFDGKVIGTRETIRGKLTALRGGKGGRAEVEVFPKNINRPVVLVPIEALRIDVRTEKIASERRGVTMNVGVRVDQPAAIDARPSQQVTATVAVSIVEEEPMLQVEQDAGQTALANSTETLSGLMERFAHLMAAVRKNEQDLAVARAGVQEAQEAIDHAIECKRLTDVWLAEAERELRDNRAASLALNDAIGDALRRGE